MTLWGGVCSRLWVPSLRPVTFTPSAPGGLNACGHHETAGACSTLGMSLVALSANKFMPLPI